MHTAGLTIARAYEMAGKAGNNPLANQAELTKARGFIRKAQWYWDSVSAENGMGFHNPGGNVSILGQAIDLAYQAIEAAGRVVDGTTKTK